MVQNRWRHRLGTAVVTLAMGAGVATAVYGVGLPSMGGSLVLAAGFLADPVHLVQSVEQMVAQLPTQPQPSGQPVAAPVTPSAEPPPQPPLQPEPTPQPEGQADPEPTPTDQQPPEGAGQIVEQHYEPGTGTLFVQVGAGVIKNSTTLSAQEVLEAAQQGLPFTIEPGSSQPQVLIMHTHTTETFELERKSWYDLSSTARTTDLSLNMAAVGEAMAQELNQAGIVTLHDTTLHDYPSYNGSYERSNATVQSYLAQYPSIKVVLDVHRDAIEPASGQRVSAIAQVEDRTAAQVMIICGADKNGNLPNFRQNLGFAAAWQNAMESLYHGLTRPVLLDYRYYNQDLSTGSLLIEVGSHGNTLEQAVYSGQLVGKALVQLFLQDAGS